MVPRQHHSKPSGSVRQAQNQRLGRICLIRLGTSTPITGRKNGVYRKMNYLICYDLDKPGQDYSDLIPALQKLGAKRIEMSVGLLSSTMLSAVQIVNHLSQFIDSNDRVLVVACQNLAAWRNLMISDNTVRQILAA